MKFKSNNEKILYYKIPVILFSLLPFFLITGPFLADLSISIINLLFLSYCLKERTFTYFKKKYFYFFVIFWLYLILNSLINNFNFDSLKISLFYFRYGVFVIAIVTYLNTDEKFIKYFFYCILACFSFLVLDGFYQYFNGENIFGLKSLNENRVSSLFGDEEILGGYLSRLWPIFFCFITSYYKKKKFLFFHFNSYFYFFRSFNIFKWGSLCFFLYKSLCNLCNFIFPKFN